MFSLVKIVKEWQHSLVCLTSYIVTDFIYRVAPAEPLMPILFYCIKAQEKEQPQMKKVHESDRGERAGAVAYSSCGADSGMACRRGKSCMIVSF